ncbi:MAG: DUF4270 domain-containing protein [Bacteroidetes bacterium]|nr:DUF4270 domain-containing protein [Bacteroidota bacterium]
MKSKYLCCLPGIIAITTLTLFSSCKKINDASTIGGDLIPAVDNITTFDTTLEVEVYNGIFSLIPPGADSLRARPTDVHFLGNITNDPLFGTSTGTIFTQLKPASFRFSFPFSKPDSLIGLDSVILVLKYVNTFGDTTIPQSVNVYEVDQSSDFRWDSAYLVRQNNIAYSAMLGNATYTPKDLDDSVHLFKDSASHQLRIKLDNSFGQRLLAYDSSTAGNNAYLSDSIFNTFFKGFAIVPGGTGNALIGINLVASKLSVYYRYNHGKTDTTVTDFVFTTTSASSNYLQRDYTASQIASYQGLVTPQDYAFIQAQPGSFAKIKIPGLGSLNNRIIHRAELIVKQVYSDPLDAIFTPPQYLYLDAFDSVKNLYRSIPYDMNIRDQNTGSIIGTNPTFGFSGKNAIDGANTVKEWRLNISRYVQNIVMGKAPVYTLRLYAPYISLNTFDLGGTDFFYASYVNTTNTTGRVKVYGGDVSGINPNRMRLRIIYSKI